MDKRWLISLPFSPALSPKFKTRGTEQFLENNNNNFDVLSLLFKFRKISSYVFILSSLVLVVIADFPKNFVFARKIKKKTMFLLSSESDSYHKRELEPWAKVGRQVWFNIFRIKKFLE